MALIGVMPSHAVVGFSGHASGQQEGHPYAGVAFLFACWPDACPEKPTTAWKGITPISAMDHKTELKIME